MIGRRISHYRIEEELGEGGMGRVYKAIDERLNRPVAIKILAPHLATSESAKIQFIQEARAASALNHPNITVIHEIDETDAGEIFIVMAYYEAETLREKINAGDIGIPEATDITLQAASGLAKAHEKGIIHRDINPTNILITIDGITEIIDFGLAKFAGQAEIQDSGAPAGTITYMSPEQILGEPIDHQTDIWSLGVVFYEMLTGRLPFEGKYEQEIIYAILNKVPDSIIAANERVPRYIEKAVLRALEKGKDARYENIERMIADIKTVSARAISLPKQEKSIVVLPFEDISPDADNEYFSNGLTEEIITDLSKVQSLRVISRQSSMRLKGVNKDSRTIGRELNVQYMLEGSVRKAGGSFRITAQLIDTETDDTVWADKFNGDFNDIFDIQEHVSRSIVEMLKLKLSPEEDRRLAERPIDDFNAYLCYLRARQEVMQFTEEGLDRALQALEQGLDIIGENAMLLGGLGYVCWSYVNAGITPPVEYLPKVEEYAKRIFELEPNSSRGHFLLGMSSLTKGRLKKALHHLKLTLAVDPNDPDALFWLVFAYGSAGRTVAALELAERLMQVDPLTPISHAIRGYAFLADGKFELALERVKKWYEYEPNTAFPHFWYAWILAQMGKSDEACSLFERGAEVDPENVWAKLGMCIRHALRSQRDALKSLQKGLADIARWDMQYSLFLAESHALIGEIDEALSWLGNAAERGFINYPFIGEHDHLLENLRGEERFEKLLASVESEWRTLEA
jgi:serine/threonine protein kinase/lipoprotein NlpI